MPAPDISSRPPFITGRRPPEKRGKRAKDLVKKEDDPLTCSENAPGNITSGSHALAQAQAGAIARVVEEQTLAQRLLLVEELLQKKTEEYQHERWHWQQDVKKLREQLHGKQKLPLSFDPLNTNKAQVDPSVTSSSADSSASKPAEIENPKDSGVNQAGNQDGRRKGYLNYLSCLLSNVGVATGSASNDLWKENIREREGTHCSCVPLGVPSFGSFDYFNWADRHSLRCQKKKFEMASRAAAEAVCRYNTVSQMPEEIDADPDLEDCDQQRSLRCSTTSTVGDHSEDPRERLMATREGSCSTGDSESLWSLKVLANAPQKNSRLAEECLDAKGDQKLKEIIKPASGSNPRDEDQVQSTNKCFEAFKLPLCWWPNSQCCNEILLREPTEPAIAESTYMQRRLKEKVEAASAVGEARDKVRHWRAEVKSRSVDRSTLSSWNKIRNDRFGNEDMPKSRSKLLHEIRISRLKVSAEKRRVARKEEEKGQFWRSFVKYC